MVSTFKDVVIKGSKTLQNSNISFLSIGLESRHQAWLRYASALEAFKVRKTPTHEHLKDHIQCPAVLLQSWHEKLSAADGGGTSELTLLG